MIYRPIVATLFLLFALAALVTGCDCSGTSATECETANDCEGEEICFDGACTDPGELPDGSLNDAGGIEDCPEEDRCAAACCGGTEECVDGFLCLPICENTRCGDNGRICCEAGQICLDGVVCAAECDAGRALCGEDLDICCDADQVCTNGTCSTPGDECGDDFDCLTEGDYCEPTIGRCLPIPSEPVCELRPSFDRVALEVEWNWTGVMVGGQNYQHTISTPAVGDVSGDGIPDVVVIAYSTSNLENAIVVAISGDTGELLYRTVPGTALPEPDSSVALANLVPDDDALEIVYVLNQRPDGLNEGIAIVDPNDATDLLEVVATRTTGNWGTNTPHPAIADLNADGTPDIVAGCQGLNGLDITDTELDFFERSGNCSSIMVVADLNGDDVPDVTGGGFALEVDGTELWDEDNAGGFPAVADLNLDGNPEVIHVRSGQVRVRDGATGSLLIGPGGTWADGTFSIPGGGTGGPPTIADFDADGLPEISSAGDEAYAVYDLECLPSPPRTGGGACSETNLIRWQTVTQDLSSSRTGSSVFDFQGDGAAEVIYNDECFLHVYDGTTGADVLEEIFPNSSRTGSENPVVVDVDRDGNSEIVVPANRDQAVSRDNCPDAYAEAFGVEVGELPADFATGTRGVFALGDPSDRWVRTRPVWNQHSYHVTNVDDRGGVPTVESDNWLDPTLNNYRQNVQGDGVFNVPNLRVNLDAVPLCAMNQIRLTAVIHNDGTRGVAPGVTVEFERQAPEPVEMVGSATTTIALLPGGSERVTVVLSDITPGPLYSYAATVDTEEIVAECDEDNNRSEVAEAECPLIQ